MSRRVEITVPKEWAQFTRECLEDKKRCNLSDTSEKANMVVELSGTNKTVFMVTIPGAAVTPTLEQLRKNGVGVQFGRIVLSALDYLKPDLASPLAKIHVSGAKVANSAIRISFATGIYSKFINGIYEPTDESLNGLNVYRKQNDPEMWLEYLALTKQWQIKRESDRESARAYAFISNDPPTSLESIIAKNKWFIGDGTGFKLQPSVMVSVAAIQNVSISLTSGFQSDSARLNSLLGEYEATDEIVDGVTAYCKRAGRPLEEEIEDNGAEEHKQGQSTIENESIAKKEIVLRSDNKVGAEAKEDLWLEFNAPLRQWHIKPASCRGTASTFAFVYSDPLTLPEFCALNTWKLDYEDAQGFQDACDIIITAKFSAKKTKANPLKGFQHFQKARKTTEELYNEISNNAGMNINTWLNLIGASIIAAGGLITNVTVFIVAAMLVSPIMGAFAVIINNKLR